MAILNYTTSISPEKTIGEIYSILSKAGAREISYEQHNGQVSAVKFSIEKDGAPLWFRMAPNPTGVLKSMERDKVERRFRNAQQAHRTAWRILKDAIEAQMAIFTSQQGEIAEVFLPYAIDERGESFYKVFTTQRIKALTAGQP